jgi:beta-glucosidase
MCSYNKINNTWACENEVTLTEVLKNQMGFKGFVMSDWWATHTTEKAANAGLDQEMPDPKFYGSELGMNIKFH